MLVCASNGGGFKAKASIELSGGRTTLSWSDCPGKPILEERDNETYIIPFQEPTAPTPPTITTAGAAVRARQFTGGEYADSCHAILDDEMEPARHILTIVLYREELEADSKCFHGTITIQRSLLRLISGQQRVLYYAAVL